MSPVKNNVGRGLNVVLVDGELLTHSQTVSSMLVSLAGLWEQV